MGHYDHRHIVCFEETNLVGNVYYANHIRWQGRCREQFIRDHAPDILDQLRDGLALVTMHCSCDYLAELNAFDEIIVRMRLSRIVQNRIELDFEYLRVTADQPELVARGRHVVACMRREASRTVTTPIPETLRRALAMYE